MLVSVFLALRSKIWSDSVLVPPTRFELWTSTYENSTLIDFDFYSISWIIHYLRLVRLTSIKWFVFLLLFPAFLTLLLKNQSWSILIWFSCRPDQHLPIRLWIASYFQILHRARSSRRLVPARLAWLPPPPGWCRPQAWHSLRHQERDNGKISTKDTSSSSCKAWHHDSLLTRTWRHGCMAHALAVLSWTLNTHDGTHNPCA